VRDEDGRVLVALPDDIVEYTYMAQIVDVSDDCRMFTRDMIGAFVQCPEMHNRMRSVDDVLFLIGEQAFEKCAFIIRE